MSEALCVAGNLLLDVFLLATGEAVRWTVTLGSHEPRWELCTGERPAGFSVLTDPSIYLGAAFWSAVGTAGLALMP